MLLIKIDTNKLKENIEKCLDYCNKNYKKMYCVVKSNAYNHGLDKVIDIAYHTGCRMFCTTELDSALKLQNKYSDLEDVLLLKNTLVTEEQLDYIVDNKVSLSISSPWEVEMVLNYVNKKHKAINVQLEFDVGLCRNGFNLEDGIEILNKLIDIDKVNIKGVFGHRASLTNLDNTNAVIDKVEPIKEKLLNTQKEFYIHFDCSSIFSGIDIVERTNCVRLGSCLYGLDSKDFKCVFSLQSDIISIRKVEFGKEYGYLQEKCLQKNGTYIGIISGGYRNGISNLKNIYCKGKKYPILGFNMEQTFVDFKDDFYEQGEIVNLIDEEIEGIRVGDIAKKNSILEKMVVTAIKDVEYIYR